MRIGGFQKMSLLDFPGLVSAIVFVRGCNFRCPYCHNPQLLTMEGEEIPEREILDYLEKRKYFLDGVAISGGEPTLQPDLADFILKVREMGYKVKLDTNGSRPEVLSKLIADCLVDFIAMDIKSGRDNYARITGLAREEESGMGEGENVWESCRESMKIIVESGIAYQFRTTVYEEINDGEDLENIQNTLRSLGGDATEILNRYRLQVCSERTR